MGRPPCCDKVGIKKGPWTPEEDIILVSYIQEHGPGNWRSVPTNTGLLRCSKSCRLRWTNYLRPGIKRGNFTPHEEGMIIHLQALLGNKWAAIASYLPQRTDNDIKNYWNTHLKKKIKKLQSGLNPHLGSDSTTLQFICKSISNSDVNTANLQNSMYASSAENISRLLQGWMRPSARSTRNDEEINVDSNCNGEKIMQCYKPQTFENEEGNSSSVKEEFESILSFDNLNAAAWEKSVSEPTQKGCERSFTVQEQKQTKLEINGSNPPLSFLEKWLFDESGGQVEEVMEMPPMF